MLLRKYSMLKFLQNNYSIKVSQKPGERRIESLMTATIRQNRLNPKPHQPNIHDQRNQSSILKNTPLMMLSSGSSCQYRA